MGQVSKKENQMKKRHTVKKIGFERDSMIVDIDGKEYAFQLADISKKLAAASNVERNRYEISPSAYGIHWPLIDEDLSVDSLMSVGRHTKRKKAKAATG